MAPRRILLATCCLPLLLAADECGRLPAEEGRALFASPQAHPIALSRKGFLYVANTTSDSVSVIDTRRREVVTEIPVGLEPVSIAVRPDGRQLWVSNHVSDSVSVIDLDPTSPSYHRVVDTVQDLGSDGVTRFDEPAGVAFASDRKAYVALSSRNQVAVVDVGPGRPRVRAERISIAAQEPRDLVVRDGRLYVIAFESSNQTELSSCVYGDDPPQCTLGLLGPALPQGQFPALNIVADPDAPDRDLFVFDTADESAVDVVSGLGTLLYGLAVDGRGRVFVAHTDARNAVNGLAGGTLLELENRIYLNRIAAVDCGGAGCRFDPSMDLFALEPPPGQPVPEGRQLATPYGIAISDDDAVLVATAAASSRVFTVDAHTGVVRDVLDVGAIPRGVALASRRDTGEPLTAYVLDTLGNTVSVVDVSDPDALALVKVIAVGDDPTPEPVRRGRIAFNDAAASSSGTFACASCHPDAHIDQLLWRIGGDCSADADPRCGPSAIRNTQSIRGLRHTVPLHWDGTLGDPFGGPNGAVGVGGDGGVDCALGDADGDHDCFLDLVQTSLAGVMCDQTGSCPPGGNRLDEARRDGMARFLASVWHMPARSRAIDDRVTSSALDGFSDFFVDQGGTGSPGTCADSTLRCHVLPLGAGTNGLDPGLNAFDAPSLRGLTDRFAQLSLGGNSPEEVLRFFNAPFGLEPPFDGTPPSEFPFDPARGYDERSTFAVGFMVFRVTVGVGPVDLFQMVEEASTGTSGALGRQLTLSPTTLLGADAAPTLATLGELEAADARGVVALGGELAWLDGSGRAPEPVSYQAQTGTYQVGVRELAQIQLVIDVLTGPALVTLTARLPPRFDEGVHRQPMLAPARSGEGPTGDPALPVLPQDLPMVVAGVDVRPGATIQLDGALVAGSVECVDGDFASGFCSSERVAIALDEVPAEPGLHLLQLQNPQGPLSNELPICRTPLPFCR